MASTTSPPAIDSRTIDEVVDETTQLAEIYTRHLHADGRRVPGWKPGDPAVDPAGALVQLFANFVSQVQSRLNQVLENNHRAFLGLIGTSQQAPQSARVPLTFTIAPGTQLEPDVPVGTPVAAASAQPQVVYTTDAPLHLTLANLQSVLIREPAMDQYYDFSHTALGLSPPDAKPFYVFSGGLEHVPQFAQVEHSIYLSNDTLFAPPGMLTWTILFGFGSSLADAQAFYQLMLTQTEWAYFTKDGLQILSTPASSSSSSSSGGPSVSVTLIGGGSSSSSSSGASADTGPCGCLVTVTNPPALPPYAIDGIEQGWLRARLVTPLLATAPAVPAIATITATSTSPPSPWLQPTSAYYNGTAVDLTKDFFPFGHQPMLGDTFYVASSDVFAKPDGVVDVAVLVSQGVQATASSQLLLAWEVLTTSGWAHVDAKVVTFASSSSSSSSSSSEPSSSSSSSSSAPNQDPTGALAVSCTIRFQLPGNVTTQTQFGVASAWLRIRIAAGDYGSQFAWDGSKWQPTNFQPPALQSLQLSFPFGVTLKSDFAAKPRICLLCNDGDFAPWSPTTAPFVPVPDQVPSLYLGFQRPFTNQEAALYVQVEPPQTDEVKFIPPPAPTSSSLSSSSSPPPPSTASQLQIQWQYSSAAVDSEGNPLLWSNLPVEDGTGLLSHSDVITFVGPTDQLPLQQFGLTRYWLRAQRVGDPYTLPRKLGRIIPNSVWATNRQLVQDEVLGSSDGSQSQQFTLSQAPVLVGQTVQVNEPALTADEVTQLRAADPSQVELLPADGATPAQIWVTWQSQPDFYGSGPSDRHYVINAMTGVITFGDGRSGLIPNAGSNNISASYAAGGGSAGNQAVGQVAQLKTTVPYVTSVTNWDAATGGADQESVDAAKVRGASILRNGGRAVTQADFIDLAMGASPAVARATAVPPAFSPQQLYQSLTPGPIDMSVVYGEGQVAVIIVPWSSDPQPVPGYALMQTVQQALQAACPPAVQPQVYGPLWNSVTVNAHVVPESSDLATQIETVAVQRINAFLHPLTGNGGAGWNFGQLPFESQFYALLAAVPGVKYVVTGGAKAMLLVFGLGVLRPEPQTQQSQQAVLIYSSGKHRIVVDSVDGEANAAGGGS